MDFLTNLTASLAWTVLGLLVLLSLILFARFVWQSSRDNARVETEFAETLAWVRSVTDVSRLRQASSVVSHRARRELPWLLRWGARRGAIKPDPGYGPPPPLTPEPVAPAPQWPLVDTNTVRWLSNPVRNPEPVQVVQDPLDAALTVGQVLADAALRGQVRQPTSMDATQQFAPVAEPVRAEVVQ